jgi:uncharacterized membrane protein HdeD (DUF308 family)
MTDQTVGRAAPAGASRNFGWFLFLGIVFVIGGLLSLLAPVLASVAASIMIGAALLVGGIFQIVHSFQVRDWGPFLWQLLVGVVIIVGGAAMVFYPLLGAVALTWVLAVVWIAKGAAQLMFAFRMRPRRAWGWMLAAGVVAVVVGLMVLLAWPFSGAFVPGILVGISLLFTGWGYIMLAMAERSAG